MYKMFEKNKEIVILFVLIVLYELRVLIFTSILRQVSTDVDKWPISRVLSSKFHNFIAQNNGSRVKCHRRESNVGKVAVIVLQPNILEIVSRK